MRAHSHSMHAWRCLNEFFGWSREHFFVAAVKISISCELFEMDIDQARKIEASPGEDIGVVSFDFAKVLKA